MKTKPFVFSIAGVSGGGKTTVTNRLLDRLNNSKALYFDDYEFKGAPDDICQWIEDGRDYSQWNLSPLIQDVHHLLYEPGLDYIILDYPFSYFHEEMKKHLQFTIYIDTPLDIALTRRILRDYSELSSVKDILRDMKGYLQRGRFAYLDMVQTVGTGSDLIIDGTLGLEVIVDRIVNAVDKQRSV